MIIRLIGRYQSDQSGTEDKVFNSADSCIESQQNLLVMANFDTFDNMFGTHLDSFVLGLNCPNRVLSEKPIEQVAEKNLEYY